MQAAKEKAMQDVALAERQASMGKANTEAQERLRADLQIVASQRQLQLKSMHERESEAIAETYENLQDVKSTCAAYVSVVETPSMGTREQRRLAFNAAMNTFRERFRRHRLHLPKSAADDVHAFTVELFRKAQSFSLRIEEGPVNAADRNAWTQIDAYMDTEAPRLFAELERAFGSAWAKTTRRAAQPGVQLSIAGGRPRRRPLWGACRRTPVRWGGDAHRSVRGASRARRCRRVPLQWVHAAAGDTT